ncbi:hypothetical protein HELRODRAFT_151664, partial [Helobdella robusta]|uniref:Cadherin domain-containing protein n=1 Tax=Helobdella robusta TaxID=6412 RepID=T1EKL6_HELRO
IEVSILDANDNKPIFERTVYKSTISESLPVGSFVLTVRATDVDLAENGAVRYAISPQSLISVPNLRSYFRLNATSGIMTTNSVLDRESVAMFRLVPCRRDQGIPVALTSSATVDITVIDINDEIPRFDRDVYSLSVLENRVV